MLPRPTPPDLLGESRAFLDALDHASNVASINRPVLIIGERGVGKELFAGRIHYLSERWDGPLIKVNCAAMNDELLESELFGHEAGAFTGATKKHIGRFERAAGGTLFLDEIPSASMRVQEKLLRIIEYGEYERVGGEQTLNVDVRIIAAANIDLRRYVAEKKFRADLLDRLSFEVIAAPPLRDRREDIALLASHFANQMAIEIETPFPGFTPEAMDTLYSHTWPGNVRELKNTAERAMFRWANADQTEQIETITLDPFATAFIKHEMPNDPIERPHSVHPAPETKSVPQAAFDLRERLDQIEKNLVIDALKRHGGNQTKTAEFLCLTYDQVRGIIRKHAISTKDI